MSSCECSSKSECKTSRCQCKKDGENCNSDCECNKEICTNRISKCGPTSGCKTKRCSCKLNSLECYDGCQCDCNQKNYENKRKTEVSTDRTRSTAKTKAPYASSLVIENPLQKPEPIVFEYSKEINESNKLRKSGFTESNYDETFQYRHGVDAYTNVQKKDFDKADRNLDHVFEVQCLSYVAAKRLYDNQRLFDRIQPGLKNSINVVENYNVTSGSINKSKGAAFRSFIHDKMHNGYPLLSLMIGTKCEKYMDNIKTTLIDSYDSVKSNVGEIRLDNSINGNSSIESIEDELSEFFDRMKLEETSGIRTRSKK